MEDKTILIAIGIIILVIILMAGGRGGRIVWYHCKKCGHSWQQKKHHGGFSPKCPNCRSTNVIR